MDTYMLLQQYWWFIVSLLGALLVFLMFVQGGNSLLFCICSTEEQKAMVVNSTGRKWEITFTTLVTFGGAFFASFPLFYSTCFGGAYWLWMIILFSFVLQAVSYEFQSKSWNLLGKRTYRVLLVLNGILAPLLLGVAVATFFTGAGFCIDKDNMADEGMPVISGWMNGWHGLELLGNLWNMVLGLAVLLLVRILGALYFINNIEESRIVYKCRRVLKVESGVFVLLFLAFAVYLLTKDGYAVCPDTGEISIEQYKYLNNFLAMPLLLLAFAVGVMLVMAGILLTIFNPVFDKGIWLAGTGTVLTVLTLLLVVGYNNTAYYPSVCELQSSLTLANSSSSQFTLTTMFYVSLFVPFVFAYIFYVWRRMDRHKIDRKEMTGGGHLY